MNRAPYLNYLIDRVPASWKQPHTLITHLVHTGDISIREGMDLYRISSMTKVISRLRKQFDIPIRVERKKDETGKLYVRYHLAA